MNTVKGAIRRLSGEKEKLTGRKEVAMVTDASAAISSGKKNEQTAPQYPQI